MGQRLNIEIVQNGNTLANAYYHWSAYTSSSLQLTEMIIESVNEIHHQNAVVRAVRLLEKTGALLTTDEIKIMKKHYDKEEFEEASSRNDGLIAISEDGINTTRRWEEGRVEIDLDKEIVNFNVFWKNEKDSYLDEYEKSEEWYQQLPVNTFDFEHIPFSEFKHIADELTKMIQDEIYNIRLENGDILGFIE